jgi:hypothetical protein
VKSGKNYDDEQSEKRFFYEAAVFPYTNMVSFQIPITPFGIWGGQTNGFICVLVRLTFPVM